VCEAPWTRYSACGVGLMRKPDSADAGSRKHLKCPAILKDCWYTGMSAMPTGMRPKGE
jgi:hypothetical protein